MLLKDCSLGKECAQEYLYKQYYGYGMSISMRYSSSTENAVEILNDSFIKIFNSLKKNNIHENFKAWIRRIIINTAVDHYRKNKKYYENINFNADNYDVPDSGIDDLCAEDLIKIFNEIPSIQRLTFNLFEIEGYSHEEISKKLGISEGTSRSNLSRAKSKLRQLIKTHY
ncbi:MAG: sigma-70 family RNA polymerase sigma factor [Bacteroidetes bacterium]|nr:sigma-70 family RNA polymerase sigma factor [Bacteroidota bacterium]